MKAVMLLDMIRVIQIIVKNVARKRKQCNVSQMNTVRKNSDDDEKRITVCNVWGGNALLLGPAWGRGNFFLQIGKVYCI